MPKRKREDGDDAAGDNASGQLSAREKRVRFKIANGTKQLARAFKLARGFERQKLGRRMKKASAEKDEKRMETINVEIAALKALDSTRPARHHLYKTLMRIKAVAQHPDLPDEVRSHGVLATDTPTLNVNARLCNSNPVAECMKTTLADIQQALGLEIEDTGRGKKARPRAKVREDGLEGDTVVPTKVDGMSKPREMAGSRTKSPRFDLDAESKDEYDALDDRIAGSESSDNEASDVEDLERQLVLEGVQRANKPSTNPTKYSLEADLDISDVDSHSSEPLEPRKAAKSSAAASPPKKSSFLPSLTMGGYISGSDSDMDIDDAALDAVAPRKNRRGQRARQKIWEQKFGSRANHLRNQPNDFGRDTSKDGWDAKRGAVDGKDRRGKGGRKGDFRHEGSRGGKDPESTGRINAYKPKKDDTGPIHPSWEAAKRAKEKKEQPVAFQGKKITFD